MVDKVKLIKRLSLLIKSKLKDTFVQEILFTSIASVVIFLYAQEHDAFESLIEFAEKYEDYELDELFLLIMVMSVGLLFIIFRRNSYLKIEVERRKQAETEIAKIAYYDSLTGLPNRDLCAIKLSEILTEARLKNFQVAVLFIDLDNFKAVNDSFGHAYGDELLKQTGCRLSNELRENDVIARMSGDEFVIIINQFNSTNHLNALANRLIKSISQPFNLNGKTSYIGLSIGFSLYPSDGQNANELLEYADVAMYEAKQHGKNTFKYFSNEVRSQIERRFRISQSLKQAINNNEFSIVYQPIIAGEKNKIVGAEALIRWSNPELGVINPDEFIPIAEENGTIFEIDQWMITNACTQNKDWQKQGLAPIFISVNISAIQLSTGKVVKAVEQSLEISQLSPKYLELELTETAVMNDISVGIRCLQELKNMGVFLALDDFGTGYSSISNLRQLKFDYLKIDKSFISNIPENKEDALTVNTIITLAHNLKIKVTAEGVETLQQLEFVQNSNCDRLQGYFVSKPVSEDKFRELLQNKNIQR